MGGPAYAPPTLVHATELRAWTHIAVRYMGNRGALFINGEYIKTATRGFRDVGLYSIVVGRYPDAAYLGSASDMRLWSIGRLQAQIVSAYQSRLVGNEAN